MPNGFGRGCGFRDWSPPQFLEGRGRGGVARCWSHIATPSPCYPISPEQERARLMSQAQMLRQWIEEIERRVQDLEVKS